MTPNPETLGQWAGEWQRRKKEAYRRLIDSYTPEQKALVAEINEASRQERICAERARLPDGATGKRKGLLGVPVEPK